MVITAEVITITPQVGVAYMTLRSKEVGAVTVKLTREDLDAIAHGAVSALFRWMDSTHNEALP